MNMALEPMLHGNIAAIEPTMYKIDLTTVESGCTNVRDSATTPLVLILKE